MKFDLTNKSVDELMERQQLLSAEIPAEERDAMTAEETKFTRKKELYALYVPFFEALYYEFRQQTRRSPDSRVNEYKAESLNRVLVPLKEMMEGEDYAELLGLIGTGDNGMSYGDAMMLLTQYRSALAKFRRK